jgi:hypothetical protein
MLSFNNNTLYNKTKKITKLNAHISRYKLKKINLLLCLIKHEVMKTHWGVEV